ncbi:hypothetical protein M409DRAFT_56468 [Zasmidium cellare ATCC 36951]|uniref:Uncharacterized protein n=1 Tax=Zasmidium cellare ATCC 36951 TaxID=1080233 RepID=A0A6A6CBT4_ZASCE|nr:uncharacterized protein M409DRAFT_56468 [Zasmidium cellare ATCC 36951]KAF2164647.1 hypothetical protein M409DRAFT_56468 [Zasmidium cellare ATCC 36951]
MDGLHLDPDLAEHARIHPAKLVTTPALGDTGLPLPPLEPPEDLSDTSDDLPAVKAMAFDKPTTHRHTSLPDRSVTRDTRGVSEDVQHYRSRSPFPGGLSAGPGNVRSRTRSPTPAWRQRVQQEKQKNKPHNFTARKQYPQAKAEDRKATEVAIRAKGSSAVVGFCLKCFHGDGDPNGKGHPFVFCPRATNAAKQLAAALEASAVAVTAGHSSGRKGISFCLYNGHAGKMEAFQCALSGGPKRHTSQDHRVFGAESFAASALQFVHAPCICCNNRGDREQAADHCALDCSKPTLEAQHWLSAKQELNAIYGKAGRPVPTSKHSMSRHAQAEKPLSHRLPRPQQPRAQTASVQQNHLPSHIHPSRLPLHHGENTNREAVQAYQPKASWESAMLGEMLQMEMQARPSSWLAVALSVQEQLRQQLMKDIIMGDPAEGTPLAIPLLELLDSRIRNLVVHMGEHCS